MTHYLIELQERAQGFQIEVLRWASGEDARLETSIAAQESLLMQQVTEVGAAAATPNSVSMKERAQWAQSARAAARAEAAAEQHRKRLDAARVQIKQLGEEREALVEQRDIRLAQCQQWFELRAAKYNRARTGWLGLPKATEHKIPAFEPIDIASTVGAEVGADTQGVSSE